MKAIVASAAIAMSAAPAVHAATFDFAAIADTFWDLGAGPNGLNMEGTFAQVAGSVAGLALMDAGITVTDGTATSTRGTPHAFFDHDGGSGPAGLGVCSSGIRPTDGVSRCSSGDFGSEQNKSDDNITEGEVLGISFSQSIAFTDLIFTNEVHDPANGSILINGNELQITDGGLATSDIRSIASGRNFTFAYGGAAPTQVYLSIASVAPVPVPAGIVLLLGALAGLFGVHRRRKAAA